MRVSVSSVCGRAYLRDPLVQGVGDRDALCAPGLWGYVAGVCPLVCVGVWIDVCMWVGGCGECMDGCGCALSFCIRASGCVCASLCLCVCVCVCVVVVVVVGGGGGGGG